MPGEGWLLLVGLLLLVAIFLRLILNGMDPEKLRNEDRKWLWPEVRRQAQDRDHAIAWMTLHMAMSEHWIPEWVSPDDEELGVYLLEQAIEETAEWGPVSAHLLPVTIDPGEYAGREGFTHDSASFDASR